MTDIEATLNRVEMTAEIVSAYVEHNSVPASELPALIRSVHDSLGLLSGEVKPDVPQEPLQPKVPIKKSVSHDYIVCLEDGRRFKSLKRHLHSEHGLSPDEYRAKWSLAKDYPMVAPAYADARSNLAKTIGLGRKSAPIAEPVPVAPVEDEKAEDETAVAKKPARRRAKAA
jgi:predicted transcriptional regulator